MQTSKKYFFDRWSQGLKDKVISSTPYTTSYEENPRMYTSRNIFSTTYQYTPKKAFADLYTWKDISTDKGEFYRKSIVKREIISDYETIIRRRGEKPERVFRTFNKGNITPAAFEALLYFKSEIALSYIKAMDSTFDVSRENELTLEFIKSELRRAFNEGDNIEGITKQLMLAFKTHSDTEDTLKKIYFLGELENKALYGEDEFIGKLRAESIINFSHRTSKVTKRVGGVDKEFTITVFTFETTLNSKFYKGSYDWSASVMELEIPVEWSYYYEGDERDYY